MIKFQISDTESQSEDRNEMIHEATQNERKQQAPSDYPELSKVDVTRIYWLKFLRCHAKSLSRGRPVRERGKL